MTGYVTPSHAEQNRTLAAQNGQLLDEVHGLRAQLATLPTVPDGYEVVVLPVETVDEFDAGEDDRVSRGHVVAGAREAQARRGSTPTPAPSPVPPWPGAVLSGLTDEDGVPTWLAQAGQVRGEAVRLRHWDDEWATWATLDGDEWVEVRAPRAAPEPETERLADPEYRAAYEAAAPVTGDDSEPPEVKRRTRSEVTDDFVEGTRTIREWVNGGGVDGPRLCEELDAWLDYWGGSPVTPTPPPVPPWPDGVLRDAANRLRWIANSGYIEDPGIKRIIRSWADELDATLVPPWPGAVLSGLTDEDGVPTWLAQAGQVRGGMVRCSRNLSWVKNNGGHGPGVWVEVRDPRAVPEPETERVNVLDAIRNRIELTHPEGEFLAVGVELREDGDLVAIEQQEPWGKAQPVAPDGTVEVLKDGDR